MTTYTALIDYDRNNAQAFYLRGSLYLQENDVENARSDFQSALDVGKYDFQLYIAVAQELKSVGLTDEGDDILRQTLDWKGTTSEYYRQFGYVHFLLGEYDLARQYLDKAAGQGDTGALLYLAQVYEAMGNEQQAQALYESYLGQNAGDPVALNRLGLRRMEEGEFEQALVCFQGGLALENPDNKQTLRRNEIAALEHLSRFAEAREKMSAFIADNPEDEEAAREYVFLQTR
jgi:tetratricopeptide (TPR) repeat protein